MSQQELLYRMALTFVPGIGPIHSKILLQHCDPEEIFHAKRSWLEKLEGIGPGRADAIHSFSDFGRVEKEMRFMEKNGITPLFVTDEKYPRRLLNCYDSPTLLYQKGPADLNASRMIAVIGTRRNTFYGKHCADALVSSLRSSSPTVVSGLASGIDAIAHRAALNNALPTIAVLGHGLDELYPPENGTLAAQILEAGGALLTEFPSESRPDRHNFPSRNRIVAGMTDATVVVETGKKGGSMITADLAAGYDRDVFAFPGRITDRQSAGCLELIHSNRAAMVSDGKTLARDLGWERAGIDKRNLQREIFVELDEHEKRIVDLLKEKDGLNIDELNASIGLSNSVVAGAILGLELKNVIVSLPGRIIRLA